LLDHVQIEYGGYGSTANIRSNGANLTIYNSTVGNSSNYGVYGTSLAAMTISDTVFMTNANYAAYLSLSNGTFSGGNNSGSDNALNGIALTGSFGQDTTLPLTPGFPYIIPSSDLTVNAGVTLTLQAGVVVKLESWDSILNVFGTLQAPGTLESPIVFTSIKDDTYGGDTNNDGTATSPAPRDWDRLAAESTGTMVLDYAIVRYGGTDPGKGAIYNSGGNLSITNSTIEHSASIGVRSTGGSLSITNSTIEHNSSIGVRGTGDSLSISNSTIAYNGSDGLHIDGSNTLTVTASSIIENSSNGIYVAGSNGVNLVNNTFTDNGSYAAYLSFSSGTFTSIGINSGSGNGKNGIALAGSLGQNTTLPLNPGFPYIIPSSDLTVNAGVTLTLQAGVVVKLESWDSILNVFGTLQAPGTLESPIVFTSIKDDTYGGDTNNDGTATSPAPRDWDRLAAESTGTMVLDYAIVRYGGTDPGKGAIYNSGGNLSITNSTIEHSASIGVRSTGGSLSISNSAIAYNGSCGVYHSGGSTTVHDSSIHGNSAYGIYNADTANPLSAENNWWGHESGPAPYGSGNGINYHKVWNSETQTWEIDRYYVDADPWIGQDYWVEHHLGQEVNWNGYEAEPVNTANGNYTYSRTYFDIPARGLPLELTLNYNSAAAEDGPLGYGWTHTYNLSATENITDSTVIVTYGDGRQDKFTWDSGEYVPPPGTFSTLTEDGSGYHLTEKDQTVYNFDTSGRLITFVDKNGNTTSMNYSGDDLVSVTEPAGRTLDFTYVSGRISQVEDPLGRTVQFVYDGNGDLVTITDPQGHDLTFSYDADHRLLTATDANGHTFVQNTYSSGGRVIEQRDAKSNLTTFAYDEVDHKTIVTDPLGNTTTYTYDDNYRLLSEEDAFTKTISYTYDEYNNRLSTTDRRAHTTYYDYDHSGNLTVITDTLGYITTMTYDSRNNMLSQQDKLGRTSYYEYDANSNLVVVTDTMSYVTDFTYYSNGLLQSVTNARGNTTAYDYDTYGNMLSTTDELSNMSWQYHDLAGRLTESQDARGYSSYYGYDELSNLLAITDTMGYVSSQTYDDVGNRISMRDANGNYTYYAYDEKDLLVTITDTLGYVTSYTYDANDNRLTVTDGNGHTITYTYDALNRLKTVQDPLSHTITYGYDANGNRTTVTDALSHMTGYAYDALDRLRSVTDPLVHSTHYGYDAMGNRIGITDANGIATNYTYDGLDRLISVTDAEGGVVSYGYDEVGNRTSVTDANLHVTGYAYDPLDRVTAVTDPAGNITQYGYDEIGNRTVISDANSAVTGFSYDSENRLTAITYPDSTVSFSYDGLDSRLAMTDTTGTTAYEYDALSRPITITHPSGEVGYRYDALIRTHIIYPGGEVVTYTYDLADRLQTVEDWGSRTVNYTYDDADRPTLAQYPNNTSASYGYDDADRLTTLTNSSIVSGTLSTFTYTLDDVGNRLQVVDQDGTTTYSYDDLYRLTQVTYPIGSPTTVSYSYDPMGNRTVMTDTSTITYTYDTADRLLASGPITYTWDSNGNMLSKGDIAYSYDYANRLVEVISGTRTITYTYNGDGVRVGKCVNGTCTTYVQDITVPLPVVLVETTDGQDTLYTYGLDLVAMTDPSSAQSYYHYDGLGSTRDLTNGSGQEIASYTYDVFGAVRSMTGSSANEFTFTGEQVDGELGLVYLRARYYDPEVGRFITADVLPGMVDEPQSLNRYVYTTNRPAHLTDPSGQIAWVPAMTALGAAKGFLGQYAADVVQNVMEGETGAEMFRPRSSIQSYALATGAGAAEGLATSVGCPPFVCGAIIAGGQSYLDDVLNGRPTDPWKIAGDAVVGGIASKLGSSLSRQGAAAFRHGMPYRLALAPTANLAKHGLVLSAQPNLARFALGQVVSGGTKLFWRLLSSPRSADAMQSEMRAHSGFGDLIGDLRPTQGIQPSASK
jgi:RHS repeat-associated protein